MKLSKLVKHEKEVMSILTRKYEEYFNYCCNINNCENCKYYDIENGCYLSYVRANDEDIDLN